MRPDDPLPQGQRALSRSTRCPPEVETDRAGYLRELCIDGPEDPLRRRLRRAGDGRGPRAGARSSSSGSTSSSSVIAKTGFIDYFLVVWDFIDWAKKQGIPVGPGRGSRRRLPRRLPARDHQPRSAALQAALRALPQPRARLPAGLRHRLLHAPARRGDRLRARRSTATQCVANIITYGTLGAKMVIRDVVARPQPALRRGRPAGEDDPGRAQHHARAGRGEVRRAARRGRRRTPSRGRSSTRPRSSRAWCATPASTRPASSSPTGRSRSSCPLTLQEGDVTVQFDMNAVGKLGPAEDGLPRA